MSLFQELMKRALGKPRDVKLPNETGRLDPRLPKTPGNTLDVVKGMTKRLGRNLKNPTLTGN